MRSFASGLTPNSRERNAAFCRIQNDSPQRAQRAQRNTAYISLGVLCVSAVKWRFSTFTGITRGQPAKSGLEETHVVSSHAIQRGVDLKGRDPADFGQIGQVLKKEFQAQLLVSIQVIVQALIVIPKLRQVQNVFLDSL